jgi:hypothetical protein
MVRLRRLLPEGTLVTRDHGYELRLDPGELDVDRFLCLLERGRDALATGEAMTAAQHLDQALAEWRGAALGDAGEAPFTDAQIRRFARLGVIAGIAHFALPISADYLTLAGGPRSLWITSSVLSSVLEFDVYRGRVRGRVPVPGQAIGAAVGAGAVWCIAARATGSGVLLRIDPGTRALVARIPLPGTPSAVLAAFGVVWVAVAPRDLLLEISPRSNAVLRTVEIEGGPVALAAGARAVWVATGRGQRLVRVDPDTHAVTATLRLAGIPHALAVASGRVWVVGG